MNTPEASAAPTFTRKQRLTKPALKFVVGKPMFILIMGPIHEGAQRGKPQLDSDGKPKKPPMVCDVVDLTTGEDCTLIAAEIIKTELSETFKNEGYIGHGFEISKQARKEGKRYDPYDISEIDLPEKFEPLAKKAKADHEARLKAEADRKAAELKAAEAEANKTPEAPASAETPAANVGGRRR